MTDPSEMTQLEVAAAHMADMADKLIEALELTIDQRDQAVRALAKVRKSWTPQHYIPTADDLLIEPWAQGVLDD